MIADRRIAKLESALTPTQLVLRWLDEAHGYGSFEACTAALLDVEPDDVPLSRLCREAKRSARAGVRTRALDDLDKAIGIALRETVFRFMLVLRINVVAHDELEKEQIYQGGYPAHLALLAGASRGERGEESHRSWLTVTLQLVLGRLAALEAAEQARLIAEERYLDGRTALFPDAVDAWTASLQTTREMAAMALNLAELDDVKVALEDEDAPSDRVASRLADLIDWSKATALEKLGEGERGLDIARAWLRPRLDPAATP